MTNPYSQRVNRQLLLAQQHLDMQLPEEGASNRLRQSGVMESALFHLYRAYLDMLRELAANYQLERPEAITTVGELEQMMKAVDKSPAEVQELVELARQGFIAELLSSWQHLFRGPSSPEGQPKQARPQGLISTRSLKDWELDRQRLQGWLDRLREISDRHRDIMIEW